MFQKIVTFWSNFWYAIKTAYNKSFKDIPKDNTQDYRNTRRINFLSIFVSKLNNLSNIESTYEIESDSDRTEHLKKLCKEIESNRFEIVSEMLGIGDFWVFPSHTSNGELFHRYVQQDSVRILEMDGEKITDILGIIDKYFSSDNNIYFLNRRHTLNSDNLIVEIYVTNEKNERIYFDKWKEYEGVWEFNNAGHIGVGRFKSPTSSRGLSPVYGVPLNYGCEEIELKIFNDIELIEKEFKNAESKIFADPLILRKGEESWKIPENVFPIDTRGGTSSASIDIFSPTIRYSEYHEKLTDDLQQYEQQVGTDRGFLTPYESVTATTATEIRRANASTIALIDRIHTAIKNGVEMTLNADAVFLNISPDLYTIKFDFFDAFADEEQQYQRIANAVDRGIAEKSDELQWIFPNLTLNEREEKLSRIKAEGKVNTDIALERILNGGT